MDYCPSCDRRLDGALTCPGCEAPAGFLDTPARSSDAALPGGGEDLHGGPTLPERAHPSDQTPLPRNEEAYVAKPFHHEAPADVEPEAEAPTELLPAYPAASDATAATAAIAAAAAPASPGHADGPGDRGEPGYPGDPEAYDDDGEDDPDPHRRRRVLLLAACLGVVLLGAGVFMSGLPWGGTDSPAPATQTVRSEQPDERATGAAPSGTPSADASGTADAEPSASASTPAADSPVPQAPVEPETQPTAAGGAENPEPSATEPPEPRPTRPDPTPTQPDNSPTSDPEDCILVICL